MQDKIWSRANEIVDDKEYSNTIRAVGADAKSRASDPWEDHIQPRIIQSANKNFRRLFPHEGGNPYQMWFGRGGVLRAQEGAVLTVDQERDKQYTEAANDFIRQIPNTKGLSVIYNNGAFEWVGKPPKDISLKKRLENGLLNLNSIPESLKRKEVQNSSDNKQSTWANNIRYETDDPINYNPHRESFYNWVNYGKDKPEPVTADFYPDGRMAAITTSGYLSDKGDAIAYLWDSYKLNNPSVPEEGKIGCNDNPENPYRFRQDSGLIEKDDENIPSIKTPIEKSYTDKEESRLEKLSSNSERY